jgi:hypothetical protein
MRTIKINHQTHQARTLLKLAGVHRGSFGHFRPKKFERVPEFDPLKSKTRPLHHKVARALQGNPAEILRGQFRLQLIDHKPRD